MDDRSPSLQRRNLSPRRATAGLAAGNMALRAGALGGRFGLTLYMAAFLPLAEIGTFGLVAAAAGIAPALFGFGLNYRIGRELVGTPPAQAGRMLRDRLLVTSIALGAGLCIAGPLLVRLAQMPASMALLIAGILWLEALAVDLQMALVSLGRSMLANALLFVRSAAWIAPAIALGWLAPPFRSAETLFAFWAAGLVSGFVAAGWCLRDWPFRAIATAPVDRRGLWQTIRSSRWIYCNDIAIVGMLFLDRYWVDHFIDREAAGRFYIAWSLANAAHALAFAAMVQPALPKLVALHRAADKPLWKRAILSGWLGGMTVATAAGLGVALLLAGIAMAFPRGAAWPPAWLLLPMLVAAILRLGADVLNYGLYSLGRDSTLVGINLAGLGLGAIGSLALLPAYGLAGAAALAIVSPLSLSVARWLALRPALADRHL